MFEEELNHEEIAQRSVKGGITLTLRRIVLKTISWGTFIILGWLLEPTQFGIFAIVSFIVNFFAYFSDVGLAAAIVQKKEKLTLTELRTIFTVQQTLVVGTTLVLVITAPIVISTFYHSQLDSSYTPLIQVLGLSLILASLKSIPSAILERKLQFNKLVIPEVAETILYNGLTVLLAWLGFGVWSFIWGVLARGIVGTVIIYLLAPWPVGFAWDNHAAKRLFSFGIPFQLNSFIALIKDNIVPTFIAARLGPQAVGYIGWAQKYAFLPLELLNDIIRVTFPAYSRLQHDKALLQKALERSLYLISLTLYPMLAGLVALMPWITQHILDSKWLPALPVFYLLCVSTAWASISTTFTNALFAIGQSRIVLKYMVIWTILTWTLVPIFTLLYNNIIGLGIAQAMIACTSIGVIWEFTRIVKVRILTNIGINALCAILMGVFAYSTAGIYVTNAVFLTAHIALSGIVYIVLLFLTSKHRVVTEISSIIRTLKG